jgi:hypothetical protein
VPKKEEHDRRKLVVEEVETPVSTEVVSSTELEKEEIKEESREEVAPEPQITDEAAKTESMEAPSEEMEKEIHQEEKHLHNIHSGVPTPSHTNGKQGNPILWILIPGIFLLGGLLGGIVFYQKGINKGETQTPTPVASASPEASISPSSTPLSKEELSKYPVRIENGSGVPGAAGDAEDILTKAGYKVASTGNASTYDYTDTIIQAKSDVPKSFVASLEETLSKTYSVGKTKTLDDVSTYDVIVIIGTSKAE